MSENYLKILEVGKISENFFSAEVKKSANDLHNFQGISNENF